MSEQPNASGPPIRERVHPHFGRRARRIPRNAARLASLALVLFGGNTLVSAETPQEAAKPPPAEETANWAAKRIYDAFHNESRCVIETPPINLDDGRSETKVFLRVDRSSLAIVTESNVDIAHPDVGIKVDSKPPIKPDRVFLDQNLLFEKQSAQIIEQFKAGLTVEAHLRFWPTWPSTGLKTVRFSLIGFTHAFDRLPGC
jgi:hypothetical protein